jgi:hypothetical protein
MKALQRKGVQSASVGGAANQSISVPLALIKKKSINQYVMNRMARRARRDSQDRRFAIVQIEWRRAR